MNMSINKQNVEKTLNDLQDLTAALAKELGLFTYQGSSLIRTTKECCDNIKWKAETYLNKDDSKSDTVVDSSDTRVRITLKKSEAMDSVSSSKEKLTKSIESLEEFKSASPEQPEKTPEA